MTGFAKVRPHTSSFSFHAVYRYPWISVATNTDDRKCPEEPYKLNCFLECGLGAYSATQNFSPQAFEMSSRTSSSDHCKSFQLFICQSSVFEDF